jgi:hypothetical protein
LLQAPILYVGVFDDNEFDDRVMAPDLQASADRGGIWRNLGAVPKLVIAPALMPTARAKTLLQQTGVCYNQAERLFGFRSAMQSWRPRQASQPNARNQPRRRRPSASPAAVTAAASRM